jgi:two-component system, OmpR family, phosphate regulon response regulator PhoB
MKKVLIVDDQPIIRHMLRFGLRNSFVLEEAPDADVAYQMIVAAPPDAIVLDVMMPGSMDGYQLCERIKRDPALEHIHVVMVTACGQATDQELGRTLGANAYFIKPFSPLLLEQHLKDALNGNDSESSGDGWTHL